MRPVLLLLIGVPFFGTSLAQTNQIVSPELLPDNRVIFRVAATNAHQVGVFVDWMKTGAREAMTKDSSGVWNVTLGPVKPGIYIYNFIIDEVNVADPVNPRMKLRARTSASLLEVPGKPPEHWEARDLPHGTVQINFHKASALGGETREVWVYTPPGYETNSAARYPLLYLLHGSNDTPAGWTTVGRANFTMDNFLAEKKVREMIIVTPFGHAVPFGSPRELQQKNTARFEEYLLKDVIPMIEAKYRIAPGRENRAIAGFSMGGGHALHVGLGHLDLFSSIGIFSSGLPQDFESRFSDQLKDAKGTNRKLNVFWIGCGKDDFVFDSSQRLSAILIKYGINHSYRPTEGAHTFNVWKEYFAGFAPLLFAKGQ
jgi:enterochelin esterase-like enzyme